MQRRWHRDFLLRHGPGTGNSVRAVAKLKPLVVWRAKGFGSLQMALHLLLRSPPEAIYRSLTMMLQRLCGWRHFAIFRPFLGEWRIAG
jgi:hypothetical protein